LAFLPSSTIQIDANAGLPRSANDGGRMVEPAVITTIRKHRLRSLYVYHNQIIHLDQTLF